MPKTASNEMRSRKQIISRILDLRYQTPEMERWRSGLDFQKPIRPSPYSGTHGRQGIST
jgi:hypothetical protein